MTLDDRFERLWNGAERQVRATVARKARNASAEDREDIVLGVRLAAWKGLRNYDERRPFAAWVCTIARNLCVNHLKSNAHQRSLRHTPYMEWLGADGGPTPLDLATAEELSAETHDALASLSEVFRSPLVLQAEGLDYDEIAAVLDCPVGTVCSRLARAKAGMRKALLAA